MLNKRISVLLIEFSNTAFDQQNYCIVDAKVNKLVLRWFNKYNVRFLDNVIADKYGCKGLIKLKYKFLLAIWKMSLAYWKFES